MFPMDVIADQISVSKRFNHSRFKRCDKYIFRVNGADALKVKTFHYCSSRILCAERQ